MITVHPKGLARAYVEIQGENSRGVVYHGSFHAILKDGAWQGDDHDKEYKAFDAPLNTYTALYAHRTGSISQEVSPPAKKLLATRALEAVRSFYLANSVAVIESERARLEEILVRAREAAAEAEIIFKRCQREKHTASNALESFIKANLT